MRRLDEICVGLTGEEAGIWYTADSGHVSFTEGGHGECLQVEDGSFWFQHRNRCIVEIIDNYPPNMGEYIFDVGGGNGYVANAIRGAGYPVVLVEPGRDGVRIAHDRGVENIICGTLEAAQPQSSSLGAVGLFDVLEHVEDDVGFLEKIFTCIKPGGRLYLTVPAYQALWSHEDVYAGHYRRYAKSSLLHVLERTGFTVDFSSYIFRWLPFPIGLLRAIPYRLNLGGGAGGDDELAADHAVDRPQVNRAMNKLFAREVDRVREGSAMRFGASIVAVASAP